MGVKKVSTGITRSFYFAFITTGLGAGLTYYLLARLFPQKTYLENRDLKFYEWTPEEVEVYAAGGEWRKRAEEVSPTPAAVEDFGKKEVDGVAVNVLDA